MSTNEVSTKLLNLRGVSVTYTNLRTREVIYVNLNQQKLVGLFLSHFNKNIGESRELAYSLRTKVLMHQMMSGLSNSLYEIIFDKFHLGPVDPQEKFIGQVIITVWYKEGKVTFPEVLCGFLTKNYCCNAESAYRQFGVPLVESIEVWKQYL